MDKGVFIAEIRKREFLWKRNKVQLHAEAKKKYEALWEEVGNIFGITGDRAKHIWRHVRDRFYRILNRKQMPVYKRGDTFYIEAKDKPCWSSFDDLMFLLHNKWSRMNINVKYNNTIDTSSAYDCDSSYADNSAYNTCTSITYQQDNDSLGSEIVTKEVEPESIYNEVVRVPVIDSVPSCAMVQPQQPATSFTSIKRIYTLEETDDFDLGTSIDEQHGCPSKKVALEASVNQNIEAGANKETADENENFLFFRSLLPFMRELNPIQQLRVRMRFQESLLGLLNDMP